MLVLTLGTDRLLSLFDLGECAPRVFTNLMKVVLSHLRKQVHLSSGYLDDFFLFFLGGGGWATVPICGDNIHAPAALLVDLGFTLNTKKSVVSPPQILEHIGFLLDAKDMTVFVVNEKHDFLGMFRISAKTGQPLH